MLFHGKFKVFSNRKPSFEIWYHLSYVYKKYTILNLLEINKIRGIFFPEESAILYFVFCVLQRKINSNTITTAIKTLCNVSIFSEKREKNNITYIFIRIIRMGFCQTPIKTPSMVFQKLKERQCYYYIVKDESLSNKKK